MSFVWITEKARRQQEQQEREVAKALADFVRKMMLGVSKP